MSRRSRLSTAVLAGSVLFAVLIGVLPVEREPVSVALEPQRAADAPRGEFASRRRDPILEDPGPARPMDRQREDALRAASAGVAAELAARPDPLEVATPLALAPPRAQRLPAALDIAAGLGLDPSSDAAGELARWIEENASAARELAGLQPPSPAEIEAFNADAAARRRDLVARFGARAASDLARRTSLHEIEASTGRWIRVDAFGEPITIAVAED